MEGKKEFYKKAKKALESEGYRYYGEDDIKGIGSSHMSKPDYIAVKGNIVIIGEIKSPKEGPESSSWRQVQPSDSIDFRNVRQEVAIREKSGEISPLIGGHEIIIRGQLRDYIGEIGSTYELPKSISKTYRLLTGYTFPKSEETNVLQALKNCKKSIYRKIDINNGSVTFTFY